MGIGKHDSSHVAMPIGNNATVTQMGRDASGGEVDMIAGIYIVIVGSVLSFFDIDFPSFHSSNAAASPLTSLPMLTCSFFSCLFAYLLARLRTCLLACR